MLAPPRNIVSEAKVKHIALEGPALAVVGRSLGAMVQSINDAWSNAFMNVVGALIVAGILGIFGFAWWTGSTLIHIEDRLSTIEGVLHARAP